MSFFKKKVFTPFVTVLLCALFAVSAFLVTYFTVRPDKSLSLSELYAAAVADSVKAEPDEIFRLVLLNEQSDMVTWHEDGERVLLLSWNDDPEVFVEDSTVTLSGELWTFTDKEIKSWYDGVAGSVTDWNLRLKQLIGLPPSSAYTHISAFWVDVSRVIRPAYQTDVTKQVDENCLENSPLGAHEAWFNDNIVYSYCISDYPWTRMGYTYDWAAGGDEYGLTEFLVLDGTEAEVEYTKTTEEFIRYMKDGM